MSLLCSLPLAAQLFSACGPGAPLAVGYVEGDYALLAPIEVAEVKTVSVKRGDRVGPGQPVATLESADAQIAVAQAKAALAQAEAQLADLQVGVKPCEIGVEIIDAIERNRVRFVPFWPDQSRSFDQGTRGWRTRMARPRFVRPSQLGDRLDRPNDR